MSRIVQNGAVLSQGLSAGQAKIVEPEHASVRHAVLRVTAEPDDGTLISIGPSGSEEVYQIMIPQSGSGLLTDNGEWNTDTTTPITVTLPSHGLVVGQVLQVEFEMFRVTTVVGVNSVTLARAQYGTTAAAHADEYAVLVAAAPNSGSVIPVAAPSGSSWTATIKAAIDANTELEITTLEYTSPDIVLVVADSSATPAYALASTSGSVYWRGSTLASHVSESFEKVYHRIVNATDPGYYIVAPRDISKIVSAIGFKTDGTIQEFAKVKIDGNVAAITPPVAWGPNGVILSVLYTLVDE